MSISELMAAAAKAQAANAAHAATASGVAKTEIAVAAAAAAGGAGEGEVQVTQAAAAGAGAAGDQGGAGAGGSATEAAAGASASAAASAAVAAPDLTALVTKVTELSIANVKLEAERDSYLTSCAAMITVVSDSLDRMSISLGGGKIDVSKMTPETLVAQHATTAATFAAKFPVGGIAAVPAGADAGQEAQAEQKTNMFLHNQRVAAAAGSFAVKK